MKFKLKKGDFVIVIAGRDKGKTGKILQVFPKQQRVLVEGVNMHVRHMRPNPQKGIQGGRVEKELSIHISNVMYFCTNCGTGVRLGYKFLEDGTKIRICKKCGKEAT